jgi:hypothetical protein
MLARAGILVAVSKADEIRVSSAASELGKRGAKKGGDARAKALAPAERSEIARGAAITRWGRAGKEPAQKIPGEMPFSMFRGKLTIGATEVEAHVLNDGRRVLTQREMVRLLSGGRTSGDLKDYLAANPLWDKEKSAAAPIPFKIPGNPTPANGYEGTLVVDICDSYLQAADEGKLKANQMRLAVQAAVIVRACAKVGIIALIDEATGYQAVRERRALQLKLQAFIADELGEWSIMFPEEFWTELARLEGVKYSPRNRPLRWGRYVMAFVYDAIDGDVGRELRKKNPNPHFRENHHQWLKKFGKDRVNDQIQRVIAVMKLCISMDDFRAKFAYVFRKSPLQTSFEELWNPGSTPAKVKTQADAVNSH